VAFRYGFQGKEKDDEIKGSGNSANYKYRMHDPRLGRFFSVDPLASRYPFYSPYAFSGNDVIRSVELEGLEPVPASEIWRLGSLQQHQLPPRT
jgi:RHS repeat-associated protein